MKEISFAPAFSERLFKNWGGPRTPEDRAIESLCLLILGFIGQNSGRIKHFEARSGTFRQVKDLQGSLVRLQRHYLKKASLVSTISRNSA